MYAMTGLESITQRIIDDAKQKAKNTLDIAERQAREIASQASGDIKENQEQMREEAEQSAALRAQRIVAAAELEGKKEFLAAKQAIIDEVFAKAIGRLASLEDSDYDNLIKKMSSKVGGEITLIPRDKEKGTGGGFIAKNGNVEYNFSFEAIAKSSKESIESELVSILFG